MIRIVPPCRRGTEGTREPGLDACVCVCVVVKMMMMMVKDVQSNCRGDCFWKQGGKKALVYKFY